MGQVDDDGGCTVGGDASTASAMMRVVPNRRRRAARIAWAAFALWWCRLAWWPLLRWARRQDDGSAARWMLVWASRVAPWAFRAVLVPRLTGADVIPLRDGRTLERGQAFGGDPGRHVRCDPLAHPGAALTPTLALIIRRPRRDAAGRVVGWRFTRRDPRWAVRA